MKPLRAFLSVLLLLCAFAARAADVVNNTANASTNQMASGLGSLAQAFDTGAEATHLDSLAVRLAWNGTGTGQASVQLWSGVNDVPEMLVETLGNTAPFTDSSDQLYTVLSNTKPQLAANTRYWVVVVPFGSGTFVWRNSNSATVATEIGAALPSVRATQGSGSWTPFGSANRQIIAVAATRLRVTNGNASGVGSLPAVLSQASSFSGPDTITFDPAVSGLTITPTSTLLLDQDVTIDATGLAVAPTISGGGARKIAVIFTNRTVAIKGLNFTGGAGAGGGAIDNSSNATLTLERCTFSGNASAANPGGAIFNNGTTTLRDCALFNNSATTGGAIYTNGTLMLTNCTLAGNTSTGAGNTNGGGGAIFSNSSGSVSLTHCTVAGNGAGAKDGGGIYNATNRTLNLTNTIVMGNTTTGAGPDLGNAGNINLGGVNFIGDLSGSGQSASMTLLTGEAGLAKLGAYGGPTQTMPPLAGSPAIDAAVATSETTDQRGASRTSGNGSAPDLGAVELGQIVVNTRADDNNGIVDGSISLREALGITAPFQAELIRFDSNVFTVATHTITLGSEIVVTKTLAGVDASGIAVTLSGDTNGNGTHETGDTRIFTVNAGATVSLHGLTLKDGYTGGGDGGAIANSGALTLTRCTLSGNTTNGGLGGAIYNALAAPSLQLTHCTLSANRAIQSGVGGSGGAILNFGPSLRLTHCTLFGNTADTAGGGINSGSGSDTITLTNTLIAGNTANSGPDIYNNDGPAAVPTIGANFIGDPSGSGLTTGSNGVISGDPTLDPAGLAAHGGPTQTIALLPGSPALDASLNSNATTDQRGLPLFGPADLGAYERQLGTIGTSLLDEDTAGTVNFTVGSVGTLSASSSAPALVGLAVGGSGAARTLTLTPAPDANGSATITVTDSLSGETQTFALSVQPVNDAPVFTKGANQNVFVDAAAQTVTGWATAISAGPADESGQTLTFNVSNDNTALFATPPAVAANGTLTFTPAAGVHGVATVTVTLSDNGSTLAPNVNTSAAQTFLIGVRLLNPESTKVLAAGGATPDAAPGRLTSADLPDDAVLTSFGPPATDDAGDVAFVGKWTSNGGKVKGTGLFLNDNCLAVIGGDASTIGGAGAQWKSFSDPVVEGGKLACIAKLSTGASAVVWNYVGTTLGTVARSGDTANLAPGLTQPDDPKFKSFKAVTIVGNEVAVLAQLATGSGTPKVTAADDVAVVHYHPLEGAVVVLREGQSVSGRKIKTLVSFAPGNGSPGCGRGYAVFPESGSTFAATALAIFDDKTQGLVQVHDYDPPTALSLGGDAATGVNNGATFASYSVPARNAAEAAAFRAVLTIANGVTKADANGIFRGPDVTGKFATVVRSGVNAGQAGTGAKFGALKDPVLNDADDIAFPATVTGVKGPGAQTLWVRPASGGLHMIAQGGADAGDLAGAKFKAFTSLAIAGGGRGAIFAATLLPNKTNVTAASANGVWAVDFNGNVRTLFRTGDQIDVGAPGTPVLRKVKSFTVLKALVGSTGVTRSFNDGGEVIWLATFTDKTQAIVTTEVP